MQQPPEEARIIIPRWWQPALIAAAVLLCADTARYLRRDDWISPNVEGFEGILAGMFCYVVVTGALAWGLHAIATRLRPTAVTATMASAAGAALGVCLLAGLAAFSGGMRLPIYGAIAAGAVAAVMAWALLSAKTARPGVLAVAFISAPIGASTALMSFQHPFMFDDGRLANSFAAAAVYAVVTLAATLLAGRGCATGRASVVAVVLVVAAQVPAAIEGLGRVGDDEPLMRDDRPNLLLIVSDTMRADYLSVNGGAVPVPWLEVLGARGTLFEQGYALAPWTLPSMIAMFSSEFPPTSEADDSKDDALRGILSYAVPTGRYTLAEKLRMEGYGTAAFVGNALLDHQTGVLRGFDVGKTRAQAWPYTQTRAGPLARSPLMHDVVSVVAPPLAPIRRIDTTGILTGYARAWLARRDQTQPFFLFVHYMDPHEPYTPPNEFRVSPLDWPFNAEPPLSDHTGAPLTPEQLQYVADYAGEIRYVDASAASLLDGSAQAAGDTLIVFTSDHGEEFWDHGGVLHGHTLYQELIHVPWIITGPGVATQRIAEPVSHIDLMPTLAGLLDIEPEAAWLGEDRSEWVRGEQAPGYLPPVFAQSTIHSNEDGPLQTVVEDEYKRIRSKKPIPGWLFNLRDDPGELHNIQDDEPAAVERLDALLDAWELSFPSTFRQLRDAGEVDERQFQKRLEHLEALGYL